MGQLYYGTSSAPIEIPDRLLAHVKVVAATKLRRAEAFTLSLTSPAGRESLWIQESIPLRFVFASPEPETLDPELLNDLAKAANVAGNLSLTIGETEAAAPAAPRVVPVRRRQPVAA